MTGQKFVDRKGRIVTVESIDGGIAQLNNGERVAVSRLSDTRFFSPSGGGTSTITESAVVNNTNTTTVVNSVMENNSNRYEKMINGGGLSVGDGGHQVGRGKMVVGSNGRPVTQSSEVSMVGVVESHNDNLRSIGKEVVEETVPVTQRYNPPSQPQTEEARKAELLEKYGHTPPVHQPSELNNFVDKIEGRNEEMSQTQTTPQPRPRPTTTAVAEVEIIEENPIHKMFDAAKKVHSIKVNLKIDEKIPDKNVIKMMEENFDESAIEYYAKDIYQKLMSNPAIIEDQVKQAIEKYVNSRSK